MEKNHVGNLESDRGSHHDVQQSCAKFDRVRRSSATRWPLKFPLLHVQVPANDVHRRDKRARADDNYFTSGEIREVYSTRVWSVPMLLPPGVLVACNLCVFPQRCELRRHPEVPLAFRRIKKATLAQFNQLAYATDFNSL